MSNDRDDLEALLISGTPMRAELRKRKRDYFERGIPHALVPEMVADGWEEGRRLKTRTKVKKDKNVDVLFEDRVWALFAELGFDKLNRNRNFALPYSRDVGLKQQLDVFAADEEIALIVECKACAGEPKKSSFKKEIEAIGGRKEGLIRSAKALCGSDDVKVVFVLATHNYYLSDVDKERLEHFGIHHFDNEIVGYYEGLTKHLGTAARFQLEANLLPGYTIPALDTRVPAVRGKMGGHTYFSFMIDPYRLLKIGYVLHRSKANKKFMPTYQRLVRKSRLQKIRAFVEKGGFFPNSIIVNIDSNRTPQFDLSSVQVESAPTRIGVLHLPKKYRSLFVIDGQHRLYGYSDTEHAATSSVPVVAFVNLTREEQVRIFMEINENQKAVGKNLRHTLNADLQWESENLRERVTALKLQISQDLGEDLSSPLYDRVLVGESARTAKRIITLDAIKRGLDGTNFFGDFSKTAIKSDGTFYRGGNDETYSKLFPFLVGTFSHLRDVCQEEWNLPTKDGGLILMNTGVNALVRLISDIVDHLVARQEINPKTDQVAELLEQCCPYLDPLHHFFKELSDEERTKIRKAYGTGGPAKFWRILQKAVARYRPDFSPPGLPEYWQAESREHNKQAFALLAEIEGFLKEDVRRCLQEKYGAVAWFKQGVPPNVYKDACALANSKNREILDPDEEKEPWDCLHIIEYRSIMTYASNWRDIFECRYTRPGEEKISGGKESRTKWLEKLNTIRNQNAHEYSVKQDELEFLREIWEWLRSLPDDDESFLTGE